jgi:hypothetical protein
MDGEVEGVVSKLKRRKRPGVSKIRLYREGEMTWQNMIG